MSEQLTRADLQNMTTEQIVAARKAGRLDTLLRVGEPETEPSVPPGNADQGARTGPHTGSYAAFVASLTPEQIVSLRRSGHLDDLLGILPKE